MPNNKIELEQLKQIDFTKTALSDIKQELINYIRNHPTYSSLWDNFYDSDSGKMLLDTFAYIARKIQLRADLIANETYPSTAQQPSSIVKILRLLGYELRSTTQAQVYINVNYPQGRPESEINLGTEYAFPCTDTEGNSINFYARANSATDYFTPVKIEQGFDNKANKGLIIKAYSGELRIDTIDRDDINTQDSEVYTLNESPVVQDSVRVFYYDASDVKQEAEIVESFFNVPSDATYVPCIIHYDEFNGAYVEFGDSDLVNVLPDNKDLEIYYCIGGGASHNIVENSISITDTFVIPNVTFEGNVIIDFNNPGKAFGGKDGETVEEARNTAPLSLRTINRCVTEQDYSILLARQGSVLHSNVLSPNDNRDYFPHDSTIPLFHVWIYLTLNRVPTVMNDLLLTKQVNTAGQLIGGDVYEILTYLTDKRIIGIENVIKPTRFTRMFFKIDIDYNQFIDLGTIETDSYAVLDELFNIKNTGYAKLIRINDIITELKKQVTGILDVRIEYFKIKIYDQRLDTVASPYYFRFIDSDPDYTEIKNSTTLLPRNYQADFHEVVFVLDNANDIDFDFNSIEV